MKLHIDSECRSCGAPISWGMTEKGRRMPLDPSPSADGNVFMTGESWNGTPVVAVLGSGDATTAPAHLYKSHFATCPNGPSHRRR